MTPSHPVSNSLPPNLPNWQGPQLESRTPFLHPCCVLGRSHNPGRKKKVYKNSLLRGKQGVGKAKRAVKPLEKALRMGKGPQSGVGSQKQNSLCLRKSLGNPHTAPRSGAGANSPGKSRWSGKGGKYPVSLFPVPGKSALSPPLVPPSLSVPVASPRSPDLPRKVLPFAHMDI